MSELKLNTRLVRRMMFAVAVNTVVATIALMAALGLAVWGPTDDHKPIVLALTMACAFAGTVFGMVTTASILPAKTWIED